MVVRLSLRALIALAAVLCVTGSAMAATVNPASALHWRFVGPLRAGRTVAISGVPTQPNVFYIGAVNGGVWRTDDAGRTWDPLFDAQPTQSIGAIAVAPSDPSVVYVGSGEGLRRPDLAIGDGMWKSTDAGKHWSHIGLDDAQQIGGIAVDPHNPNRVFAAVMGHPYGPNATRGLYRSTDGETWVDVFAGLGLGGPRAAQAQCRESPRTSIPDLGGRRLLDAIAAVNVHPSDGERAIEAMLAAGVHLALSTQLGIAQ